MKLHAHFFYSCGQVRVFCFITVVTGDSSEPGDSGRIVFHVFCVCAFYERWELDAVLRSSVSAF